MQAQVVRGIVSIAVVIALGVGAGCGGGGGGGNDNGGPGEPTRTPTPARTFSPAPPQTIVGATPSRELFTKNGKDDGTLILSLAFPTPLALPATISCTFDVAAGQQLLATDVTIGDKEVTVLSNDQKGIVGDPSMLVVDVSVS